MTCSRLRVRLDEWKMKWLLGLSYSGRKKGMPWMWSQWKCETKTCAEKGRSPNSRCQFVAQHAEAGAAVEDVDLISQAHFDAGGIASVAQVLGLWSGRGAAHAPKLNSHKFRCCLVRNLRLQASSRQFESWFVRLSWLALSRLSSGTDETFATLPKAQEVHNTRDTQRF